MESLVHSPANIIRAYLLSVPGFQGTLPPFAGVVNYGRFSWPIFVGILPDAPDNAITIYDTTGSMDGRHMRTGQQIEHYGLQVRVRAETYDLAWRKADEILRICDRTKRNAVTVDGDTYTIQNIDRSTQLIDLGEEKERLRRNIVFNALVTIPLDAPATMPAPPLAQTEFIQEVPLGLIDGDNRSFQLSLEPYSESSVLVFLNGLEQHRGVNRDYVFDSSDGPYYVVFNTPIPGPPLDGDDIIVYYYGRRFL